MSPEIMTIVIIASFLVTLLMGLPVAFCLIGLSIMFMLIFMGPKMLYAAYSGAFNVMNMDIYISVLTFVFMAAVLQYSGIAERLYDAMYRWSGGFRGGLAIGTIIICTILAAMTGMELPGW